MKKLLLIRHGLTAGNLEKRYLGRTDQPLAPQGVAQLQSLSADLPPCQTVFASPLKRCRESARLLFPGQEATVVADLRECDFGLFEGKTAAELAETPAYAAWLETGCQGPIPGGEDVTAFKVRTCRAFAWAVESLSEDGLGAFVIHGGSIMAILEAFAQPKRDFYASHIPNGAYVACSWLGGRLTITGGALC